ncbi:purine-cytosine permease family protein [Rhizosaccharibacter radicis]|uniref:Cytosine permease n=1 Tax=Rhizosaccharibacter radicis TaxID=2782605 RepID=A0ABT1W2B3_9PROT|nr:cytosine permease [Acetobacteraceae bacterium KSS12]
MEEAGTGAVTRPVPADRRHMTLDRVFWSHFSPNLGPGGWVTGVLLVHLGLSPAWGIAAIVLGNLLGAVPVALAAVIGPVTGVPQMEASRRVLGRDGLRLPAFLNWIYCVGWDAVNNVPAAVAFTALAAWGGVPLSFAPALAILAALQMTASIYGHHVVQILQKYLGAVLLAGLVAIGLLALRDGGVPAPAATAGWPAFVLAVAILASFNLSWASYSSDYTRYLPADTPPRAVVGRALAGLLLSSAPFQLLGLFTARAMGEGTPAAVIGGLQHAAGALGPLALALLAMSSITGNSFNDNTASYSLISAGVRVGRVWAAIATALLGFVLAVLGHGRYAELYTSYLVVTLYWIAPWTGIVLADWWCRPGASLEAGRSWTAEATLFVSVSVLTIVLFSSSDLYVGPVARALGGADIGYYAGFGTAFGGTIWLSRRRNRFREVPA